MSQQIEVVSLESLVKPSHTYRKFLQILDFTKLCKPLLKLEKNKKDSHKGFGIERLFRCLLLQFVEDISDRELARFLEKNVAGKYFCSFTISQKTPDYSLFSKTRSKIGPSLLSKLFKEVRISIQQQGLMSEVFTFVDASYLISKASLWEEKDKGIKEKTDKINNQNISQVAADKEAKIGCKRKNKYWFGYKKHVSVDIQSGLINKVAVTPANLTDAKGVRRTLPNSGAIFGDKGYCTKDSIQAIQAKGCYNATIKKNNMKGKNKDLDRWYSDIRSPYESSFLSELS